MMRLGWTVEEEENVIDNRTQLEQLTDRIDALNDEVHEFAAAHDLPVASDSEIEGLREAADHLTGAVETLIEAVEPKPTSTVH